MHSFTDIKGQVWEIRIAGDVVAPDGADLILSLRRRLSDRLRCCLLVWRLCAAQTEARGIDPNAFWRLMFHRFEPMREALLAALRDFDEMAALVAQTEMSKWV